MSELFTIVVTVYQREYFLPHAITSVLWQSHANWELLIYAEGGHLGSRGIIDSVRQRHPEAYRRIRYREVLPKPGCWGNHMRRMGLEEAKGEFICFLPHDCMLHPQALETHAAMLREGCGASVVGTHVWAVWRDNSEWVNLLPTGAVRPDELSQYVFDSPSAALDVADLGNVDLTSLAFNVRAAMDSGVFAPDIIESYSADFDSFCRVRSRYAIGQSPKILASHF